MISYPVHKLLTKKSGRFVFSAKYSSEKLKTYLIECKILYQTINDLPILPKISSQIQEDLIKRSIFSTAAIEGNPLSENKVAEILTNPNQVQSKEKAQIEIQNLKNAYTYIKSLKPSKNFITLNEKLLRDIHKAITKDIDYNNNIPGNFRNHIVKVGDKSHGGIYTPPKITEDIKILTSLFIKWINNENILKLDPIIRAGLAHYHLGLIHPFADGNGRTARIVEALILQTSGIKYVPVMLSNFYYRNIDDYYWAFSNAIKNKENDISAFLEFVLIGMVESLKEIKEIIIFHIRILTLKEYYLFLRSEKTITHRQYDLLLILMKNTNQKFTLKELGQEQPFNLLYRAVSPLTIRRDVQKLIKSKLLRSIENTSYYTLNLKVLD